MTAPQFISTDYDDIYQRLVADFSAETGLTVSPSQNEALIMRSVANEAQLIRLRLQYAAEQMLVEYSGAPALDAIARLSGVTRLPASAAAVTVTFTFVAHPGLVLPAGMRIASSDGRAAFVLPTNLAVPAGDTTASAIVFASAPGPSANGYAPGTITRILDPQPFLSAVTNTTTSAGGGDIETDDALRERVYLAPSAFSTAGSRQAYIFHARNVSPEIIDVQAAATAPGVVGVWPLVVGGVTPPELVALVEAALSDEFVRPLTDTVVVEAPDVQAYDIEVEITALDGQDTIALQAAALAAVTTYANSRAERLGRDVVVSQVTAAAMVPGAYSVEVVEPSVDVVVALNEVAVVGTITVSVTGTSPE